ncbi:BTB/POZ and MATH domain protein [Medicago truncatula]|uniref:BTB/POZ and MATH domain protein n=2 Tax=Medicago truncatula TaxID=3880 RepID=G7LBL6_MEDTR|nr:BTB/POZ and MATH domain protein [Medicago truncatula]
MDTKMEKYESNAFQAGGHTWKLVLYPSGNSKRNGKGHVSLYLAIADTEKLSRGWEVYVNFKLFVLDYNCNNYLTIQDADGVVRKFNEMKSEWGFDQLISLEVLFDPCNGYLVEDSCVFGAEVLVIGHSAKSESLSMAVNTLPVKPPIGPPVEPPTYGSLTWRLQNLLTWAASDVVISKTFTVGDREWNLQVTPKGDSADGIRGKYLSLFLQLTDCERFPSNTTVNASFKLKILDQLHNQHYEKTENSSFCASHKQRGYSKFISLSELYEVKNGYFKDDDIILEVEILKMAIIMEPLAYENFTWKLENLSKFDWLKRNHSGPERHWKFEVHTKGVEAVSKKKGVDTDSIVGKYLALFVNLSETKKFQSNRTINLTLKCKILDQLRNKYYEKTENYSLLISDTQWLLSNVISLSELNLAENGYIKDDAIIMEVEISNISMV